MYQHQENHYVIRGINAYLTAKWAIGVAMASRLHIEVLEMIRSQVRELISTSEHGPVAVYSEIMAVLAYGLKHFRYTADPPTVELMYHPVEMIRRVRRFEGRWIEDCESLAAFTLTCLQALGIPSRIAVVAYEPEYQTVNGQKVITSWPYLHIFAEALIPGQGWRMVDPSMGYMGRVFRVADDTTRVLYMYPPTLNHPIRWVELNLLSGEVRQDFDSGNPLHTPIPFKPGHVSMQPSVQDVGTQELYQ